MRDGTVVAATRAIFLWIPHPRPLRRWIGEDGKCVEGARFSDLGQLFACAKFRRGLTDRNVASGDGTKTLSCPASRSTLYSTNPLKYVQFGVGFQSTLKGGNS